MPTFEIEISYSGTLTVTLYDPGNDGERASEIAVEDMQDELPDEATLEVTEVKRVHG